MSSQIISSPRPSSLSNLSQPGIIRPSLAPHAVALHCPKQGEVWCSTAGANSSTQAPSRVLIVNCNEFVGSKRRSVLNLLSCEADFVADFTHLPIPRNATTGIEEFMAVDAEQSYTMLTKDLTQRVGRISAELMEDVTNALSLVYGFH